MSSEIKNGKPETKTKKKSGSVKIDHIRKQLETALQEKGNLEEKYLRLKAEFENFRRRKEKEIVHLLEFEGQDIFRELLPIFDDFDRLIQAVNTTDRANDDSIKQGLELIQTKINKFLGNWKVESIGQPGDELDAELHDAMMVRSDPDHPDESILEVFEKGYKYKDRVIRHAKVVVNKS